MLCITLRNHNDFIMLISLLDGKIVQPHNKKGTHPFSINLSHYEPLCTYACMYRNMTPPGV